MAQDTTARWWKQGFNPVAQVNATQRTAAIVEYVGASEGSLLSLAWLIWRGKNPLMKKEVWLKLIGVSENTYSKALSDETAIPDASWRIIGRAIGFDILGEYHQANWEAELDREDENGSASD